VVIWLIRIVIELGAAWWLPHDDLDAGALVAGKLRDEQKAQR